MDRSAWLKTPYANTSAKDPDSAITALLQKYQVVHFSTTHAPGPGGNPGYGVRFELGGLWYVVAFESLSVKGVDPRQLLNQVKRVVYYTLKTLLEASEVFVSRQKLLLPFLEVGGMNLYEQMKPFLADFQATPGRLALLGLE
ncbi:MAG: hypothetical protein JNJ77_19925 [Planctomycetia bacterium]|nr:hypothetical protein [Planctomycetia bacterium]